MVAFPTDTLWLSIKIRICNNPVYALEPWTLVTLPSSQFRNCEKSFFAVIGRTDKPYFKFRSLHIPLASFECPGFKGLSEDPSVILTSRSFAGTG